MRNQQPRVRLCHPYIEARAGKRQVCGGSTQPVLTVFLVHLCFTSVTLDCQAEGVLLRRRRPANPAAEMQREDVVAAAKGELSSRERHVDPCDGAPVTNGSTGTIPADDTARARAHTLLVGYAERAVTKGRGGRGDLITFVRITQRRTKPYWRARHTAGRDHAGLGITRRPRNDGRRTPSRASETPWSPSLPSRSPPPLFVSS